MRLCSFSSYSLTLLHYCYEKLNVLDCLSRADTQLRAQRTVDANLI